MKKNQTTGFWGTKKVEEKHMSYGQYSWLITIKNGASHPMVPLGIYKNHYFWILIMDGMTINHIVSIDHGSYGPKIGASSNSVGQGVFSPRRWPCCIGEVRALPRHSSRG